MKNNFSKYQGLGNDFIIFDARGNNLDNLFTENKDNFIEHLCNRNFGIGADGIILIGSYHPSPRNVNTGRLTQSMMISLLEKVKKLIK